jgi:CRP/FNR family transcriptional regulator, cyclic AMP receptor protein
MVTLPRSEDFSPLRLNPLYEALPEAARRAVEARARLRRFAAGQQVFSKGETGDGVYAVLSGELEYRSISPSGKQSVLNVITAGKWMGDISTLDGNGRTMDCWAIKDCCLMHLPTRDFDHLVDHVPAFARMLILLQAERVRQLLGWVEALTKLGAEGRLAERLLALAGVHGIAVEDGLRLNLQLTQSTLAEMIGTTRQRVNQVLNQWQHAGTVRFDDRTIVLCDLQALRAAIDLA